jgi:hypothetical protein
MELLPALAATTSGGRLWTGQLFGMACCLRVQEEFPERMTNAEGWGQAGATTRRLLILLRHF